MASPDTELNLFYDGLIWVQNNDTIQVYAVHWENGRAMPIRGIERAKMKRYIVFAGLCFAFVGCTEVAPQAVGQSQIPSVIVTGTSSEQQINEIRAQANLPPLKRNAKLDVAAQTHSRDMAANQFMGHTGSDGSSLRQRVDRTGYNWCMLAENVSRGYSSDLSSIEGWRKSPNHYVNLTKKKATEYGLANVNGFRTMVIGNKCR